MSKRERVAIRCRAMSLPDLSRLTARPELLRDLGRTLRRLGVSLPAATPVVAAAAEVPPALRQPIRAFHLRRLRDPRGYAMRMLMFRDPVGADEARAALGDAVDPLVEAGLLERQEGGAIVSPFILGVLDDLYILSDDLGYGRDAVMGFGETTMAMCGAAFSPRPARRVLDLGCGSGTAALFFARRAEAVVGTDINPRAVALARVNAALNDLGQLDFREGDLFAPVAGETFDLIVSQPPFVPRPEGVDGSSTLYGGRRGDELALSLLAALPKHLAPGGRAVLFIEWPERGDTPLEQRVRDAIGPGDNLLILRAPASSLDAHAALYAAGLHPGLGAAFEAEALLRREHFEREGIRAVVPTITVIERADHVGGAGWTAVMETEPLAKVRFTGDRIDKILAARALARSRDRLLAATLRVPESTLFAQEQVGPGADVPSTISARFAPEALLPRTDMNLELLGLLTCVHEAETVREGIERFAEMLEMPLEKAMQEGGQAVREALLHGMLEVQGPESRTRTRT